MKNAKKLGIALTLLFAIYVGSYLSLSAGGCFEPASIGLNGVKSYGWAPYGFVTEYRWRSAPMVAYLPLYYLDRHIWHTDEKAYSGRYPINEVKPEEIWRVYEANGF